MKQKRFVEITGQFSSKKILVVGDLMMDTYMWGTSERISPEAPVPIVHVTSVENNPGGAANVALNLASLGVDVSVVGVVGEDSEGLVLKDLLSDTGINTDGIVRDADRPTTVKARVISQGHQVVRTDREVTWVLSDEVENSVVEAVESHLSGLDGVILQDYNKGFFGHDSLKRILESLGKAKIPIYVDPKKDNFLNFRHVRYFKPNLNEFESALSAGYSPNQFETYGQNLREKLDADIVMVTRSEKGSTLFTKDGMQTIPTQARKVHDVSGAGDTVISVFTLADVSGATPEESANIANLAAGRVCEEIGVVPITEAMLSDIYTHHNSD
ncbi:MAG: D-glycero-beta-D-manno-heptose-7-phosphate kinase [Candidatus Marinimicrobia bacterium]|jgi:rfaE bifunctional protein kinase chain/domain|nr:D-glycero-beta-D-manno-heptose-7-phosphate kinase [Candidatus Neomarinimicrobiota bacterium]MBT3617830.1 D-glycero-beta-D-manno-heptose-7-phosphate kinase [Candidatus Neomarinimicrobiota bacterium]MBT3828187.1 D-glycero-beta-D-manno-heptose-7-phosphate kinase [Candidatus Neomarinimicrobiota bacterium]MBT3997104.1 D-glycero-beta-D-manno-heptose-7-phosphate kinase [Candidatus Neomarinimicrobiota bacterium]MBT4280570.1 D-glycero-beta-D-manno-heptose-7-phosphate kinase [Candidatus Neomarinimicro